MLETTFSTADGTAFLGNLPQGLSHRALLNAAALLEKKSRR